MANDDDLVDAETAKRAVHRAIEQLRAAGLNATQASPLPVAPAIRGKDIGPWHPSPHLLKGDDNNAMPIANGRVKVSWSQAICAACYDTRYPGRPPVRVRSGRREQCCDCGMPTIDGIYFREDPMTVRYPRVVRDE